jgi:phage/plasmid primase-like uncharacterized protein
MKRKRSLWTIQYIKEDGAKRFAKDSRKHGSFHVVGAANAAEGLQNLANSPVIVVAEGYATAATLAKYGNVPAVAAFDSGNLLAVATALHKRWPGKGIMIAGDDDHKLENNPGRVKALEAAAAVDGVAIFPELIKRGTAGAGYDGFQRSWASATGGCVETVGSDRKCHKRRRDDQKGRKNSGPLTPLVPKSGWRLKMLAQICPQAEPRSCRVNCWQGKT